MFQTIINFIIGLFKKPAVPTLEETEPVVLEESSEPWPEPPADWDADAHADEIENDPEVVITEDEEDDPN